VTIDEDPVLIALANLPVGPPLTAWERRVIADYEMRRARGNVTEITTEEFLAAMTYTATRVEVRLDDTTLDVTRMRYDDGPWIYRRAKHRVGVHHERVKKIPRSWVDKWIALDGSLWLVSRGRRDDRAMRFWGGERRRVRRRHAVGCDHGVTFDECEARGLDASEVRRRWPRVRGTCPKGCGFRGIAYASWLHYAMGDW
jgi:hypothetical protein